MSGRSALELATKPDLLTPSHGAKPVGFIALAFLAAWCGLVAGLLEVGTIVFRANTIESNHIYRMSRHFVWLIPVTNVCVLVVTGLVVYLVSSAWPRRGRWAGARLICALTLLPMFLVGFHRVYGLACFSLALGAAARLVPMLERNSRAFQRFVWISFPVLAATVFVMGAFLWVGDRIKERRENARELPSPGSSNVLLIVMDTVAAGHLSLHGYERDTSRTLNELAERGIQFDRSQASSSWTLPSHATIFTGRWLHELSVGWLNPLDDTYPTLAEYLGARGYATAGFIANTGYCASDSGLARGFTRYNDYIFPEFTALKMAALVSRTLVAIQSVVIFLDDQHDFGRARPYVDKQLARFLIDRKDAAVVNRELLDWLSQRAQKKRPFLAFLNYGDAHSPYQLPPGRMRRFGSAPKDSGQHVLIESWMEVDKTRLSPMEVAFSADAYDDCVADLDEQLGKLLDTLRRDGTLDRTWLIITSDHGESFGEHSGVFLHGTSLYQSELHVPLLIVPPGGTATRKVVKETVSLRDLAATIVDVLNLEAGSPFPGDSLARYWANRAAKAQLPRLSSERALSEVVPGDPLDRDSSGLPNKTWPLGALKGGDWSYIRREGEVTEQLFDMRQDAREQHNLAGDPAARPMLEQMREALRRSTSGPLVPQRFNR
jgi:arylsulfatase A-like enzyme